MADPRGAHKCEPSLHQNFYVTRYSVKLAKKIDWRCPFGLAPSRLGNPGSTTGHKNYYGVPSNPELSNDKQRADKHFCFKDTYLFFPRGRNPLFYQISTPLPLPCICNHPMFWYIVNIDLDGRISNFWIKFWADSFDVWNALKSIWDPPRCALKSKVMTWYQSLLNVWFGVVSLRDQKISGFQREILDKSPKSSLCTRELTFAESLHILLVYQLPSYELRRIFRSAIWICLNKLNKDKF